MSLVYTLIVWRIVAGQVEFQPRALVFQRQEDCLEVRRDLKTVGRTQKPAWQVECIEAAGELNPKESM